MTVEPIRERPTPQLAHALVEFEAHFNYPLGPGRTFRISHGEDYPRFFRAMGEAACFVAHDTGRVLGTLGVAIRPLSMPDGNRRQVAYIGDLKTDPAAPRGIVLLRLAMAALAWGRPRADAAYGVVIDGTLALPESYSGRVGIPGFGAVAKVFVIRIECEPAAASPKDGAWEGSAVRGAECYRAVTRGRYAAEGGDPSARSKVAPAWLVDPGAAACGLLEDTRRAKRLIDSDGTEMISAHLSFFAWRDVEAAAGLIGVARRRAALLGFPALFVAVPEADMEFLSPRLTEVPKVIAPATVYAANLPAGLAWNINTSEI